MRRAATFVLVSLLLAACGGRADVYEVPPDSPDGATRAFELPDPIPAVPAYRVELRGGDETVTGKLAKIEGVAVVAPIAVEKVRVDSEGGRARLRVGVAQPLRFRSVAPASTRDADFVWTALMSGRAVVTFDAAERLGLDDGGKITVGGAEVQVGAFADVGVPNFADVLLPDHMAEQMGVRGPDVLIVGAETGVTIETLGKRLRAAAGRKAARVVRLLPDDPAPVEPADDPEQVGTTSGGVIPPMTFRILRNGFIEPDRAWVASNIVTGSVPIIGTVSCHRFMFGQLQAALTEIANEGLAGEIRSGDYGGCYVPRFIDRDPGKPLSMHAFGLAIDLNTSTNQLGTRGDMHPGIVAIFEKWGFIWGGRWSRPDPMHFELGRLIET
jgi:hypothetical protein